ncbi:sugar transferase [Anabaena sp. FACHB-709]|uniref:Glucosyltransferase n=2 Tax=Nostocaceae TaxID=1162 RepID=A0A1Z4KFZ6_ANAVA|nr:MULTISPECIES: sugar transferase [Nostocaceae]BAY67910.1 glucosyltransferase [Trichormus variabilis NIES-23]HBW29658.1 STAS domain-containing protein [Nostoc sp. UBA8866]MBD2170000.1 sugar transferase [Anabaena cylindrica FACHB-318]MBD2261580.1 sugar transferase [Anabaena sp. FACHB-709]MBD2271164.1 sugar transferase [Nostoc sp. PCC 7120 = FACHB-418]
MISPHTKTPISLVITRIHGTLLVQLPPRLTVIEAISFREYFQSWIEDSSLTKIILDFGQTTIIDSSGVGSLISNHKSAQAKKIELIFWSIHPQVKLAFSLVGLEQILNIEANTDAIVPTATRKIEQRPPLTHPSVRSPMKRAIDIVGAVIGLSVTAVLFVPIAIAIKLDSPGPVLFSQTRCGWMGRRFRIWKFRSMVTNAEALKDTIPNQASGAFFKNDKDPRITRVGRFLRKTSLDEFPQFWNILTGDMSLVGTRPPTPNELEHYEVANWQRLDVKPGLSGEWQVNGRSKIRNFEDVIQLDLRYQNNWSLVYDLKLILKTIIVVFKKDSGAV